MNANGKSFIRYGERSFLNRARESGNAPCRESGNAPCRESGNAMIYVIIVIALFAALTFIMSRGQDTGETSTVATEKVNIVASQLMQSAAQVTQSVEQMLFTAGAVLSCPAAVPDCPGWPPATPNCNCSKVSLMLPSHASFNDPTPNPGTTPPNTPLRLKAFHPDGGGIVLPKIPPEAIADVGGTPAPGFYLGRFSNVQWSLDDSGGNPLQDAVVVAYKISRPVCERINAQLTGSPVVPTLTRPAAAIFIDNGSNTDFMTADCPACEGQATLCVKDSAQDIWAFYSLLLARPPIN